MLDPVEPTKVGKNVNRVVNYNKPGTNKDRILSPGAVFTGVLENVDVTNYGGFDHFNINENKRLRKAMYTYRLELSNAMAAYNNFPKDKRN